MKYVNVILPLAIRKMATYLIPEELRTKLQLGHRVEVQFGSKKRYAGIVASFSSDYSGTRQPKKVLTILDDHPVIHASQLDLWHWIASYYGCTIGEVMQAALPASLKLQSESIIILNGEPQPDEWKFNDAENILIEALIHRNEISIQQVDQLLPDTHVYPVIKGLMDKEIILIKERLKESEKAKTKTLVHLADFIVDSEEAFIEVLEIVKNSKRQTKALLSLYDMSRKGPVERKALQKKAKIDISVIRALEKKEIITLEERPYYDVVDGSEMHQEHQLSEVQQEALSGIVEAHDRKDVVLLNGVTGSGKTHLYIERIKACLEEGQQALFLLPEIALTSQLITRLKAVFGEKVQTYHSGLNDRDRRAIWDAVYNGHPIILGARSSLLLPFSDLGLIVVDEEHDGSYKQHDPSPRYQARDVAIYMKTQLDLDVILGSATPSLESQWNVRMQKYHEVALTQRHGNLTLPEVHLIDLKKEKRDQRLDTPMAESVIEKIKQAVEGFKQVLIFQNRRGYAPVAQCHTCGWHAECPNCDVSLTYHKVFKNIRCHYCGFREPLPRSCPNCGSPHVDYKGFGTERIEDELKIIFPEYRIARMDYDTAGGKKSRERLIERMEEQEIDILIGTQMITKGLDFDNIGLVVVVSSDQLLFYPHFRTNEKAFQMLQQVSGRAGRKEEGSEVLIQGYDMNHPVLRSIVEGENEAFYQQELDDRKKYLYPPYYRLIQVEAKHKKPEVVREAMDKLAQEMRRTWGNRIVGPADPTVARIRGQFIRVLMIKIEKQGSTLKKVKTHLLQTIDLVNGQKGMSGVRFNVNVDP